MRLRQVQGAVRCATIAGVLLFAAACRPVPPPELPALPVRSSGAPISFQTQVQPLLAQRCVVCHGCNDAPCQLLLSSHTGLARGASKAAVYDTDRLTSAAPTRLFVDAHGEEWRQRGFFSVLGATASPPSADLLIEMLALGRAHPFVAGETLPDAVKLDIDRTLACPTAEEFPAYAQSSPYGGMPYGMAPLSDAELEILTTWV
ncbi:MAG: fatty acid cis/trans isomerase, partial [Candidatus Binatia bacterium]